MDYAMLSAKGRETEEFNPSIRSDPLRSTTTLSLE
jgi:hypothetical protein